MTKNVWVRVDRIMRWLHLYTGLFLVPWMVVYGISAFCLNHGQWFTRQLNIEPPRWEVVRKVDFAPNGTFPHEPAEQAREILRRLQLEGAHRIQNNQKSGPMTILRICGTGHYRITWRRGMSQIIVEKQRPFSWYRLVHFLHFRAGYGQKYFAHIVWAVVVDVVALSILLWVISGVYVWWRMPRKRLLGSICVVGGSLLFIGLVIALCS